jgi:hypothetical protein
VKLSNYLLIPIIPKPHDVIETKLLALCNGLIEEWVVHPLKICPVNILARDNRSLALARDNRSLALAHDNRGVEILMQLTPKSPFQVFGLLILLHVLLACIHESYCLLEVVPSHGNSKLR